MIGTSLGPYKIIDQLGAGGMGEVYRAHDPRLDRDVAIKLLPADFSADAERLARFEREAKLLAQLNHSNIAGIYGLEDADGVRFIAMECVEGETLAERLVAEGRIELDDAIDIARQIAEALEAAHEAGIVHRDLKPANVLVTPEGKVKVLDLGLAKAWEAESGTGSGAAGPDLSHSPTVVEATRSSVILGTAAYMSPEQARGKPVDKRTDIWAFGCVLYEMLAGKRVFDGGTASDTMAAILKEAPDFDALPGEVAPGTRQLLRRCLDKDPRLRLRDIGEARFWLSSADAYFRSTTTGSNAEARQTSHRLFAAAAVIAVVVAVASFFGGVSYRDALTAPASPEILPIATASGTSIGYWYRPVLALSPDGRWLAYVTQSRRLYVQDLEGGEPARLIPRSDEAEAPFFSPGSDQLAFFRGSTLQTVRVAGGEPSEAATVGVSHPGGTWEEDGSKLVVPVFGGPLQRIDPGGEVIHEIEPRPLEQFFYPSSLPGGEHFLVSVHTLSSRSIVAMSRDGSSRTVVVDDGYYGRYVPTGHILWIRGDELVAASFDLDTLTMTGDPAVVARNVLVDRREGFAEYAVAADGKIAYLEAEPGGEWLQLLRPGEPPETLNSSPLDLAYIQFDVSPNGDLLAYNDRNIPSNIQLFDLTRKTPAGALVASPNFDFAPVFSPDGTRVTYTAIREDYLWEFREKQVGSPSPPTTLLPGGAPKWPGGWSPDDGTLTFYQENPDTGTDIMLFTPASGEEPSRFVDSAGREDFSVFSGDGEWIFYSSNESLRSEIYAAAYPNGVRHFLSTSGGRLVSVASDGSVFFNNGEVVMRVELTGLETAPFAPPVEFVRGVDSGAWDILPDGSGVIAVQRRSDPQLKVILGAAELFPRR